MADYTDAGTYVGDPVMDYVRAPQLVQTMIETGASKKDLTAGQIFVRGMYGGSLLAFATGIAFWAAAQGVPTVIAGMLFPVGFIIINALGVDLITGYFALVPPALPTASDTTVMGHAPRADRAATTPTTPSSA